MMFEENAAELAENAASLGLNLTKIVAEGKMILDFVHIERSEVEETGEYDLEGLFIRLKYAIETIGAKRVVLDTIEALFAGLPNQAILRAELRRLFRWLKDQGMTAVITGEKGEASITRYGLEEYVADCVITLDHRINGQVSTRRLRVVKYRGSAHGTNEYPFLISQQGISVLPITSLRLDHKAPLERIPTGIAGLDDMLGGQGVFRGASILVSGSPGTGKSSVGASFVNAACRRGEKALLFAYEESAAQILRNMRSIGINLEPWIRKGLLKIHASRPTLQGLEQHLVMMHDLIADFQPAVVAVDPISNLALEQTEVEVKPTLMRLIDLLKQQHITALFTSLTTGAASGLGPEDSQVGISSLMDVWLLLRNHECNGERNRTVFVLKARGMRHSNQVREFIMSDRGIVLIEAYLGDQGVLTGTARLAQEESDRQTAEERSQEYERKLRQLGSEQKAIDAKIAVLQAEAETHAAEFAFVKARRILGTEASAFHREAVVKQRNAGKQPQ